MVLVWKDSRLAHSLLGHPECLPALTTRRPSNVPVSATAGALRRGRWCAASIFLGGLGVAGLGCFTNPINRAPVVTSISADSSPVMRGQGASFSALAYDPDSDSFTLSWVARKENCPDISDRSTWPDAKSTGQRLTVDSADTNEPFCVWAFATDRYGAVGANNLPVNPGNVAPVAMIELLSPKVADLYPLYKTFELSDASTGPDNVTRTTEWTLLKSPTGSTAQLRATGCSMAAAGTDVHCFTADVPGPYTVSLKVTADGKSSTDTKTYVVNVDTLPCIDVLTCVPSLEGPPTLDPTQDQSFTVYHVEDDGDSTPLAQYIWFVTVDGALLPFEHNFSMLTIPPNQYQEGDVTKIRVEAYDRNRQKVKEALSICGDAADRCAGDPQRPNCFQRVTWTVNWL
jgi:hypothetical protein